MEGANILSNNLKESTKSPIYLLQAIVAILFILVFAATSSATNLQVFLSPFRLSTLTSPSLPLSQTASSLRSPKRATPRHAVLRAVEGAGEQKGHASAATDASAAIEQYATQASSAEPAILAALRATTESTYPFLAQRMLSGPLQGRLLKTLTAMARAQHVLEIGTFTGYSALCFAEAVPDSGSVVTMDIDERAVTIAKEYFAQSEYGHKVEPHIGPAMEVLQTLVAQQRKFDVVFLDADKQKYIDYYETILGKTEADGLLAPNGVILADNVLWKGLVLAHVPEFAAQAPNPADFGNARRMLDLAGHLHRFNEHVKDDPRTETVLIPLRDGLTVIRRR